MIYKHKTNTTIDFKQKILPLSIKQEDSWRTKITPNGKKTEKKGEGAMTCDITLSPIFFHHFECINILFLASRYIGVLFPSGSLLVPNASRPNISNENQSHKSIGRRSRASCLRKQFSKQHTSSTKILCSLIVLYQIVSISLPPCFAAEHVTFFDLMMSKLKLHLFTAKNLIDYGIAAR